MRSSSGARGTFWLQMRRTGPSKPTRTTAAGTPADERARKRSAEPPPRPAPRHAGPRAVAPMGFPGRIRRGSAMSEAQPEPRRPSSPLPWHPWHFHPRRFEPPRPSSQMYESRLGAALSITPRGEGMVTHPMSRRNCSDVVATRCAVRASRRDRWCTGHAVEDRGRRSGAVRAPRGLGLKCRDVATLSEFVSCCQATLSQTSSSPLS